MAFFKEAGHTRTEFNRVDDPPIPITYLMLTGIGKGFSTGVQQAVIVALYLNQVRQAGLEAWAKLEEDQLNHL